MKKNLKKTRKMINNHNRHVINREINKPEEKTLPPRIVHDAKEDKVFCVTDYKVGGFMKIRPITKYDVTDELDKVLDQVYHKATMDIKHQRVENEDIKIVCLVGSRKFKKTYEWAQRELALNNHIVLSVSGFGKVTKEEKEQLDNLHKKKILLCDIVYVIDDLVDGNPYIGESTRSEIEYAEELGKAIVYHSSLDNIKEVKMNVVDGVKVVIDEEATNALEEKTR